MAKRIFQKTSVTNEQKLNDLLLCTEKVNECRVWTRALNTDGYPHMLGNIKGHRLAYELATGEDIKGYVIRHSCDNPKCINPDHLLKGTVGENNHDKFVRNRQPRIVTRQIVFRVRELLATGKLLHKEIALICGIDQRRVSDIQCNRYDYQGKFVGNKRK